MIKNNKKATYQPYLFFGLARYVVFVSSMMIAGKTNFYKTTEDVLTESL